MEKSRFSHEEAQVLDTQTIAVVTLKFELTVKFLNFRTPEKFAVIYLKFKTKRPNCRVFHQKNANWIAISEDPDQTAPLGAVCSGSALFAQTYLPENLG